MLTLFLSILISVSHAKTIKVAVIDSGFDTASTWSDLQSLGIVRPRLCEDGHKNFTKDPDGDLNGHGTHIAGLIAQYAEDSDYCLVIYKYVSRKEEDLSIKYSNKSFRAAIDHKVNIINYSGGGRLENKKECSLVKEALDKGIIIVAAAGNNNEDISKVPFYPASCDDRVLIVMNVEKSGVKDINSNFTTGKKKLIEENGSKILSILPNNKTGFQSGTSQSTAITTGKIIKHINTNGRLNEEFFKKTANGKK